MYVVQDKSCRGTVIHVGLRCSEDMAMYLVPRTYDCNMVSTVDDQNILGFGKVIL